MATEKSKTRMSGFGVGEAVGVKRWVWRAWTTHRGPALFNFGVCPGGRPLQWRSNARKRSISDPQHGTNVR